MRAISGGGLASSYEFHQCGKVGKYCGSSLYKSVVLYCDDSTCDDHHSPRVGFGAGACQTNDSTNVHIQRLRPPIALTCNAGERWEHIFHKMLPYKVPIAVDLQWVLSIPAAEKAQPLRFTRSAYESGHICEIYSADKTHAFPLAQLKG